VFCIKYTTFNFLKPISVLFCMPAETANYDISVFGLNDNPQRSLVGAYRNVLQEKYSRLIQINYSITINMHCHVLA
jgi:hypothetical protein